MKDGVAYPSGVTIPAGLSAKVQARVAWSSLGIHAHFNVIDPAVAGLGPYLASDKVSFQIGGKSPLLGEYIGYGKDKGMLNIQMRPPSPRDLGIPGLTGRPEGEAHLFFIGHLRSTDTICRGLELPVVAPIEFASRVTADGYAHELFIPWASLNRTAPPSSGTAIALDMTLFDTEMPGIEMPPYFDDTGLQGVVAYRINTTGVDLASSCCSGSLYPDCDDRTWCSPSLE
jgi:hypothetical protein